MPRRSSNQGRSDAGEGSTRDQLIEAAQRCFARLGIHKTTLEDVATAAGLTRGTVYRYFADRDAVIAAVKEAGSKRYYDEARAAMDRKTTLAGQVGAFAQATAQTQVDNQTHQRVVAGDTGLMEVLLAGSESALVHACDLLRPYVQAAKDRGELRARIDVDEATEFLARIVRSLVSSPESPSFDFTKPRTVAAYVERYAVRGLTARP